MYQTSVYRNQDVIRLESMRVYGSLYVGKGPVVTVRKRREKKATHGYRCRSAGEEAFAPHTDFSPREGLTFRKHISQVDLAALVR